MISDGDSISADVQLICTSPTGENREISLSKSSSSNSLSNIFIPDKVGTYALNIIPLIMKQHLSIRSVSGKAMLSHEAGRHFISNIAIK